MAGLGHRLKCRVVSEARAAIEKPDLSLQTRWKGLELVRRLSDALQTRSAIAGGLGHSDAVLLNPLQGRIDAGAERGDKPGAGDGNDVHRARTRRAYRAR